MEIFDVPDILSDWVGISKSIKSLSKWFHSGYYVAHPIWPKLKEEEKGHPAAVYAHHWVNVHPLRHVFCEGIRLTNSDKPRVVAVNRWEIRWLKVGYICADQ